jgi:hypothetical protein
LHHGGVKGACLERFHQVADGLLLLGHFAAQLAQLILQG